MAARERPPLLLHREPSLVHRLLRDLLSDDVASIRLDQEKEYQRDRSTWSGSCSPSWRRACGSTRPGQNIFEDHGVASELERALRSKVWLESGGYIVINQTEALVAIDVNTGRYTGKKDLEETILKTNLEAVKEIVRQIRLRDLGGIIVRRLHRHGGAQEPPEGDGGAGAGAAARPLAVEDALGERVRSRDPDPQAGEALAGAAAVPALPLLHGSRHHQERGDGVLGDLRRGAQAGGATSPGSRCCCA